MLATISAHCKFLEAAPLSSDGSYDSQVEEQLGVLNGNLITGLQATYLYSNVSHGILEWFNVYAFLTS